MKAKERPHNDGTNFQGERILTLYTIEKGKEIIKILSPKVANKSYYDNNHILDFFGMGTNGLVKDFTFMGDSEGRDAPYVKINFNKIKIQIQDAPIPEEIKNHNPGTIT